MEIRQRLAELHIDAEVTGRPKHYWSIYEKMVVRDKDFDEIIDLLGVRVVVESVKDCYAALGSIHAWWRPVQGRFKDYIAQPKFNLYQSLHTTVVGPGGRPVEVQIRTEDMNRRAEFGVAAHWGYKESESAKSATDSAWLQRLVDWQHETEDPEQFMKILKGDLEIDEVFVFTPEGQGRDPPDRGDAGRLRVRDPHRGGAPLHRRPCERAAGAARRAAHDRRHRGDRDEPPGGRGPDPGLAAVRARRRGPGRRSASGSRRSGGRTPSTPAATTS